MHGTAQETRIGESRRFHNGHDDRIALEFGPSPAVEAADFHPDWCNMISTTDTLVGSTLGQGRYQLKRKLGEGGMALVFLAHDKNIGTDVVVKIPKPIMLSDPEFVRRFKHEIRSMVQLAHPHVVKVRDAGDHNGTPFYVMELLTGGSLESRFQYRADGSKTPIAPERLADWLPDVAAALDFIHAQGVVHRDIKPGNILFDAHGNAFVSDFGIAKAVSGETAMKKQTVMTQAGIILGTGPYLAPEVSLGEKYDGRADQYALAATVYEVLGGRVPFSGTSLHTIILQQTSGKIPPLSELAPSLPKGLCRAIEKGLNPTAKNRHATCAAFAAAVLAEVSAGSSTRIKASGPAAPALKMTCRACSTTFRLPANPEGKTVTCPSCRAKFAVAKKPAEQAAAETLRTVAPQERTAVVGGESKPASKSGLYLVLGGAAIATVLVGSIGLLGLGLLNLAFRNPQPAKADQPPVVKAEQPPEAKVEQLAKVEPKIAPQLPDPPPPPVQPAPTNPIAPTAPKKSAPPMQNPVPPKQNPVPPKAPADFGEDLGLGRYLVQSMIRVTTLAKGAKNFNDYGYIDNESILSAWVTSRQSVSINMPLQANTDYLFLAAGDNDAEIIDLEIFTGGTRVAWDQTNHRDAMVTYNPPTAGVRQIKLTLFQSRNNVECFCSLVILKRNGWGVEFNNLDDATFGLARQVANWNKQNTGKIYGFRKAPTQWAVYGGILRPGDTLDITNVALGFGPRVLFASCDKLSNKLELSLSLNKKTLQSTSGPVPTAPSLVQNCTGIGYQLRLRNASTLSGASVAMMGVLDVKNAK